MNKSLDASTRINLNRTSVLVVDPNAQSLDLLRQILNGFGVRTIHACQTVRDAERTFCDKTIELVIIDPMFAGSTGYDFIRFMRRDEGSPNRCVSVIAALGHQTLGNVRLARDAGANVVVAKPLSPEMLLQRIHWVARDSRQFIVAPGYCGPDRRFKNEGPPIGTNGRRADDLSADVPDASAPNMDQSEIDEMFKPRRVAL